MSTSLGIDGGPTLRSAVLNSSSIRQRAPLAVKRPSAHVAPQQRVRQKPILRFQEIVCGILGRLHRLRLHRSLPIFGSWSARADGCGGFGMMV